MRPRLPDALRVEAARAVQAVLEDGRARQRSAEEISRDAAAAVVDALWAKLEGDMQDRLTALIYAARGVVESTHSPPALDGLKRALGDLRGREVAATSSKQLKEGPWHGHDTAPEPEPPPRRPPVPRTPTREEIEAKRPTRPQLAEWGVPWPPPRRWRKRLLAQADAARAEETSR